MSAADIDVDRFVHMFPKLRRCPIWRTGEPRFRGKKHTDSGFNLFIGEANDSQRLRERVLRAMAKLRPMLVLARRMGADIDLDFALFVGGTPFNSSVSFNDADLVLLAKLGVSLTVSAYPVVNDADDPKKRLAKKVPRQKR